MMKFALPMLVLGLILWLGVSCVEQDPAEISVQTNLNGQPRGCHLQVFNSKNVQITEVTGDYNGVAFVKALVPGTYTIKFVDSQSKPFPAVITITVKANDSQFRTVELSDPTGGPGAGGPGAGGTPAAT